VNSALDAAVMAASNNRGFELIIDPVEIRVFWLSDIPYDLTQPDVDNMLKPLIDVLNKIFDDDRQVHRILAERADINRPPSALRNIYPEIQDDQEYTETGEVIVVRVSSLAPEYRNRGRSPGNQAGVAA